MNAETITLHGGPKHGETMVISDDTRDELVFKAFVSNKGEKGTRTCQYTRVHNNSEKPTHDFEWAGFSTPFVPVEA